MGDESPKARKQPRVTDRARAMQEDDGRKAEAWRLRVKEGRSYPEISREMGIAISTAHAWCKAVREEVREDAADLIDSVTTEALERLRRTVAIAAEEYEATRDTRQAMVVVAAEKRLAELVGADAPKRTTISGPDGGPVRVATMTDADLEAWARGD